MVENDRQPLLRAVPFCSAGCEACTIQCATMMALRDGLRRQLAAAETELLRIQPLPQPTRH